MQGMGERARVQDAGIRGGKECEMHKPHTIDADLELVAKGAMLLKLE